MRDANEEEIDIAADCLRSGIAPSGNPLYVAARCDISHIEAMTKLGIPLVAAEKALYASCDKPEDERLTAALKLNELREERDDYLIPMAMLTQTEITEDEAMDRAIELQKTIRAKINAREKEEATERDKHMRVTRKMMMEQREVMKAQERSRNLMNLKREKEAEEEHKASLNELMANDYRERFGHEPPAGFFQSKNENPSADALQLVTNMFNNRSQLTSDLKATFELLVRYLSNIVTNGGMEEKFLSIKTTNRHFVTKISEVKGAAEILEAVGFERINFEGEIVYKMARCDIDIAHLVKIKARLESLARQL